VVPLTIIPSPQVKQKKGKAASSATPPPPPDDTEMSDAGKNKRGRADATDKHYKKTDVDKMV
jgi:hypothetical protein